MKCIGIGHYHIHNYKYTYLGLTPERGGSLARGLRDLLADDSHSLRGFLITGLMTEIV